MKKKDRKYLMTEVKASIMMKERGVPNVSEVVGYKTDFGPESDIMVMKHAGRYRSDSNAVPVHIMESIISPSNRTAACLPRLKQRRAAAQTGWTFMLSAATRALTNCHSLCNRGTLRCSFKTLPPEMIALWGLTTTRT